MTRYSKEETRQGIRYQCKDCNDYVYGWPPGHPNNGPLPLFATLGSDSVADIVENPWTPERKQAYVNHVVNEQAKADRERASKPVEVVQDTSGWLTVQEVARGFGYKDIGTCNNTIRSIGKRFYKKYPHQMESGEWVRGKGVNTIYSPECIEAYAAHIKKPFNSPGDMEPLPVDALVEYSPVESPKATGIVLSQSDPISLVTSVKQRFGNETHLDRWLQFCEDYPGLQWFDVNGVILFPIPLVEQLKADNPDREDLSYDWDYSKHLGNPEYRVSVRSSLKGKAESIPPDIQAIAEMPGTKEVYQVQDIEHPDAWGFVLTGGKYSHGTAAKEAHVQIGKPMGNRNIFHAVTFPLMYAYLVQGRSRIAKQAQYMGARSITDGVKSDIEQRKETTPLADMAAAAAIIPQMRQEFEAVKSLILIGQAKNEEWFSRLEQMMINTQIVLEGLTSANPATYQESVDWLCRLRDIETSIMKLGNTAEETQRIIGEYLTRKRNLVSELVRDLHLRFVYIRYHGHCLVTGAKIVGTDPITDEICILKDANGKPLGEVDHNFQVNSAGKLSTWLIETKLNRQLANDINKRIEIQDEFTTYQKHLELFDSPLLALSEAA
jgi:hypothetical protein